MNHINRILYLSNYGDNRYILSEGLLLEHPNQAKKFLKEKNIDDKKANDILDKITKITNRDGYTGLLTKFHVNSKIPIEDLESVYQYIKSNKLLLKQLPNQIFDYDNYRDFKKDVDDLEKKSKKNFLTKKLTSILKNDLKTLSPVDLEKYNQAALAFADLKPQYQKSIEEKLSGYKSIEDLVEKITNMVISIEQGETYEDIKQKILNTEGAVLTYENENENVLIAHVMKFEASKKLGCTTNWCIARDHSFWNKYKKAGQKYFYIWDFNYPVENPRFLIGTAYNEKKPESSQTHLKGNQSANLKKIFQEKDLSFDILKDYLQSYRDQFLSNISVDNFFGKLVSLNDRKFENKTEAEAFTEQIRENVRTSKTIQENGNPEEVIVDIYMIDIGDDASWFEILGVDEDEYNSIKSMTYHYDAGHNSEDAEFMGSGLDDSNIAKIKQIAKLVGYKGVIDTDEGKISKFLEKYNFDNIISKYNDEYQNARSIAVENEANAQLENIPFDLDESYINISDIVDYGFKTQTKFNSFDEFINDVIDGIDLNLDAVYEAEYQDLDLDELNQEVGKELDEILEELDDPDSDLYQKHHDMKKATELLEKLNFKLGESGENWYYEDDEKRITVTDIFPPDEDAFSGDNDDYDIHNINIDGAKLSLPYSTYRIEITPKKFNRKSRKGLIKAENLYKYVTQYEIPYQESVKQIKNIIRDVVKEKLI